MVGSFWFGIALAGGSATAVPGVNRVADAPACFTACAPGSGALFCARTAAFSAALSPGDVSLRAGGTDLRIRFLGASRTARLEGNRKLGARVHLFAGRQQAFDLPAYDSAIYRGLYAGIDAVYRPSQHRLKSEFVLARGARPESIRLAYEGLGPPRVASDGSLVLVSAGIEIREAPPVIYQDTSSGRVRVAGRYHVFPDGSVGFDIGEYDRRQPLIIDPEMAYSTYLGGSGFDAGTGIVVDGAGNIYIAGWTESADFPLLKPAQAAHQGGVDAFVAKLDPTGTALLYCTYLGGRGDDRASGIAVDAAGSVYVAGWTSSPDFPVLAPAQARFGGGGRDGFVAKLTPAGDALTFSTYVGGTGYDSANAIAVSGAGQAYVAGETASSDFQVRSSFQSAPGGLYDAFVAEYSSWGALLYSTRLGGAADDRATAIAVDAAGNFYLAGRTSSMNFPRANSLQSALKGAEDAFVAKFNAAGSALLYSTYLGGSGGSASLRETATGIAVDAAGSAYVAGFTASLDFPVASAFAATHRGGGYDAFVARLNAAGSALVFSTYLGGSGSDLATAIGLDSEGEAYVAGMTTSADFPVVDPLQTGHKGSYDAFISRVAANGRTLTFSTLFGADDSDAATAVAISSDAAHIAGQTLSHAFPLKLPIQTSNSGLFGAVVTGFSTAPSGAGFVPVAPCRVMDTRPQGGKTGPFGPPAMAGGSSRDVPVAASGCGVPGSAVAYVLNITVIPQGFLGFLAVWPTGMPQPNVSTLNAYDGMAVANAVVVPAGSGGAVSVYVTDRADVLIDISGYFTQSQPSHYFRPVTPCRVLDTRASGGKTGPFGPPAITGGSFRDIPIPLSGCGVPSSAAAYSVNVTAIPQGFLGYLSVWPAGTPLPAVSTLNAWDGAVVANEVIVAAGAAGAISLFVTSTADVVIDINGYYAPAAASPPGQGFHPLSPCRIMDTRASEGKTGPFGPPTLAGGSRREVPVPAAGCGVPSTAVAYSVNVTAIPRGFLGFLSTWPAGLPMPNVSTLNAFDGSIIANEVTVPAGVGGAISVFVTDDADVLIDISGYFGP